MALDTIAVSATKIDVTGLSLDGFRSDAWEPVLEPCGATLVLASEGAAVTFTEELRSERLVVPGDYCKEACAPLLEEGGSGTQRRALSSPSARRILYRGRAYEEPRARPLL